MSVTAIDRRVAVQSGAEAIVQPFSQLRDMPFLVLLGEPGIGKTTALRHEATAEGGEVLTCREAMNGVSMAGATTAYLDALDEYRAGENGKDKLLQLANAISASGVSRWRLSCRAEDWRAAGDMAAMRRATNNVPIVVAHLLPLDEEEARAVLAGLGEPDPARFIDETNARGAGAFLESPLSLRLLHSLLRSHGVWPESRFELFDRAIWGLAHEFDPARVTDPRPAPEEIVAAAALMCFYVLATGAKALWRSNALPDGMRTEEYVNIHSLQIDPATARAALDTAIFRGEGQSFEPSHRAVAEFLAGRYLAQMLVGDPGGIQFPLRRAAALITGHDHKAPSESRGLYAWFAAHLSRKGDHQGAIALIERDAATVLAYGDAAAFTTAGRKAILINLDRDDPYFLSSRDGSTVFAGLAGEDLVDDFISILDGEVKSHLQVTVLQALGEGPPLAGMQEKLHALALACDRPLWQRLRASDAWIRGGQDHIAARRQLSDELRVVPQTHDQVSLRASILAGIPTEALRIAEIAQLLCDLNGLPPAARGTDEDDAGALMSLLIRLKASPRPDLFDRPVVGTAEPRGLKLQVRHFLQQALAAAIAASPDIEAGRLWAWIKNTREYEWDRLEEDLAKAVGAWIDRHADRREIELFRVLMDDSLPEDGPWMASNHYISVARRLPSEMLAESLMGLARENKGRQRKRLFEIAAYAAKSTPGWPALQERVVAVLKTERGFSKFIKSLLSDPNKRWKDQQKRQKDKEAAETETARTNNIASLTPKLNAIATGNASEYGVLRWASERYRNAVVAKKQSPLANIENVTDPNIASAIAEGFVQFAIHTDIKVTAADLGKAEATNSSFPQEHVVAAGLHLAISQGREEELVACPLVVALVALRQSYFSDEIEPSLASWATRHLGRSPDLGAEAILQYWNAAIDAGDTDLDAIHYLLSSDDRELISRCLKDLLHARPGLPAQALKQALTGAARFLGGDELRDLVGHALADDGLDSVLTRLWQFAGLALQPDLFASSLSAEALREALLAPDGELANAYYELSPLPDQLDRIRIAALGIEHPAEDRDWGHPGSVSRIIRAAIRRLSASNDPAAGKVLKDLVNAVDPSWRSQLTHSAAEHARMMRDKLFEAPSVTQLRAALAGGPPASAADLVAIVLEETERYRTTLRTGSEMPWKRYWNTDKTGAAIAPQIENEDRDRLLELLRPRFERYGIAAGLPEARMGENTRADILMLSHAGKKVPIEAKRHYNNELWTAPVEQLNGYAADEGADGRGIYLVFWFGAEFSTPPRTDGKPRPNTAAELEARLSDDLPLALKDSLSIVVLDVSRPEAMITAVQGRKKQANGKKAKTSG